MKVGFWKNTLINFFRFFGFAIVSVCIISYLYSEIYDFKPPSTFTGNFLYNPYSDSLNCWQQSNFHAHSFAWGGVTNGKQQAADIIKLYKSKGYNYASVSNYEQISPEDSQPNSIEVYEHGYNIFKTHHLVIMPEKVCYNDFPLWQFASAKQFMINRLKEDSKAVVLAHPKIRKGFNDEDLKKLTGYNLMEVLNHTVTSDDKWDTALSAGKPVWIVGDDDSHNALDTNQTFTNWTMINCEHQNKDSLIGNLANGNAYAVKGKNAENDNRLVSVKAEGLLVEIQLQNKADSIKLIGQNGVTKKIITGSNKILYSFQNNDTYIRAVIYNKASTMFLNPVLRFNGISRPENISTANINFYDTVLYRSGLLLAWLIIAAWLNIINVFAIIFKLFKNKWYLKRKTSELILNIEQSK